MSLTKYDIDQLCLFDDEMFRLCLKDCPEGIEYILRTIIGNPTLRVLKHRMQKPVNNPGGRSVRLDVYAEDADGKKYDIEIQKGKAGELPQRARYYSSVLDARTSLKKNETFDRLPDSFIIFICSYDIMSADTAMKWYRRKCLDNGEELGDGSNIIFVNGSYAGDDDIGDLVRDLKETDPDKIKNSILSRQVTEIKNSERERKGGRKMVETHFDRLMAKAVSDSKTETSLATAKRMLAKGKYSVDEIAEVTDLPVEKVKELAEGA